MPNEPQKIDDLCPRPGRLPLQPTEPLAPAIHLSSVYRCSDPTQAQAMLAGEQPGYVYSRDGHPNADMLAEKCRELHRASCAAITASGMGALALAALSQLSAGDHVVVSDQLYGRSRQLFVDELARLGITSTVVDASDSSAVGAALTEHTRLLVVETISNPLLRVANLAVLAKLAHERGAALLVDNTFANPATCRPLEHGADLVVESLTKSMSGHGDVLLGLLCGRAEQWQRVPTALSTWGLMAAPLDCWLAARGLETLAVRAERAAANALVVAEFLSAYVPAAIDQVHYPGLASHPDRELAGRQFGNQFGSIVTFGIQGGLPAVQAFMQATPDIPFCPSLGETCTTLSHPASTSHRGLSAAARHELGIGDGLIRLSVGIESSEAICRALAAGLAALE